MDNFFLELNAIPTKRFMKMMKDGKLPKTVITWEFINEIKPIDIYCYMHAKYGKPNGLHSCLKEGSSDNLIHWDWTLESKFGVILVQGHNFRTEVYLAGKHKGKKLERDHFIQQIKSDFENYGESMGVVRSNLEKWTRFLNPYHRIDLIVSKNIKSLRALDVKIEEYRDLVKLNKKNLPTLEENWKYVQDKCDSAISMTFGIRSMLPVLAESFINLLIFILAKPEIKTNVRFFKNTIRQPIDIRVQSLHLNCDGFIKPIDYKDDRCKKFHTLMNERNDLLHGNVEVSKLEIGEVYFNGKVPIFVDYEDAWQSTMGISLNSVKYDTIFEDHSVVTSFIEFILSHLSDNAKKNVELLMNYKELGYDSANDRLALLFTGIKADFIISKRKSS